MERIASTSVSPDAGLVELNEGGLGLLYVCKIPIKRFKEKEGNRVVRDLRKGGLW